MHFGQIAYTGKIHSKIVSSNHPQNMGYPSKETVNEKGYVTLELTAEQEGGHSSMPPPQSAIGILSSAIHHLQENPFPAKLEGPSMQLFEFVGPEMAFGMKFLFANKWLFGFLTKSEFEKTNSGNAAIRTTIAPTIFHAGTKENVLPQKAMAKFAIHVYLEPEIII